MSAPTMAAAAAGLVALPVLTAALFLSSGAADPPAAGAVCTVLAGSSGQGAAAPPKAGLTVSGEQAGNARIIVAAAKGLGMPQQAAAVALMTAQQESRLLNLANPTVPGSDSYPHQGTGSDQDSVGLFQQRPSQGWGAIGQLMDPGYASTKFLTTLTQTAGWQSRPPWQAAQAVQRSADGTAYAQWTSLGTALATALWDNTTGTLQCTAGAANITGPSGTLLPEACSVVPDPTTGRGCLTPRTANIALQLMAQGWNLSCWDPHPWNPDSNHPKGKACDAFPGPAGVRPNAAQKARGDALATTLIAGAPQTGASYLIWSGQQTPLGGGTAQWRPYTGGGVYDPSSVTGGHYDHLHFDVS